eukprot:834680_1
MEAYRSAVAPLWKQGFVNGTMLGSFILLYAILTLYGSHLLYKDIRATGCDASAGVPGVDDCGETGSSVFGAMLGAACAAQGVSQVANCIEAVTAARTVCATALVPIQRTLGEPEQEIVIASDEDLSEEIAKKKKEQKKKKQAAAAKRRRSSSRKGVARKSVTFHNEEDDESYDSLESGTTKTHTL